eukprot:scaffold910_cov396-Prasinococcus_capsulatus_cf.AAC.35
MLGPRPASAAVNKAHRYARKRWTGTGAYNKECDIEPVADAIRFRAGQKQAAAFHAKLTNDLWRLTTVSPNREGKP